MGGGNIKLLPEIELLTEKLLADPKSRIFAQLADAYRKSDLIDEAIDTAKKGLEQHPKYAIAHLILGRCYLLKGMYALAREEFELTIKNDPQNLVGYKLLGETFEKQNMYPEALKYYQMVLDIEPTDIDLSEKIANLKSLQPVEQEVDSKPGKKTESQRTTTDGTALPPDISPAKAPGSATTGFVPMIVAQESTPGRTGEQASAADKEKDVARAKTYAEDIIPLPPVLAEGPMAEDSQAMEFGKIIDDNKPSLAPADDAGPSEAKQGIFETEPAEQTVQQSESRVPAAELEGPTSTLAEIYVQQGFVEKAIDIYKELIASQPENESYKHRIDELLVMAYPEEGRNIIESAVEADGKTINLAGPQKPETTAKTSGPGHHDAGQTEYSFLQMFAEMEKTVGPEPATFNQPEQETMQAKEETTIASPSDATAALNAPAIIADSNPTPLDFGALFNDYGQPPAVKEKSTENSQPSEIAPENKKADSADSSEGGDTVNSFQSWLAGIKK